MHHIIVEIIGGSRTYGEVRALFLLLKYCTDN